MSDRVVDDLTDRWLRRELTPWQQQQRRYRQAAWRSSRSVMWGGGSATTCQRVVADVETVSVDIGYGGSNYVTGVMRCGSVWSCPVCSPRIRSTRARQRNR